LRLLKQVRLFFQEGNSDKVYDIDLCESGDGYLVNFRYGRRGASLKEGTKTIFPVALPEAEKLFSALEEEKRKKGYVAAGEASIQTSVEPTLKGVSNKRAKAIVKLLKAASLGELPEAWKLSRVIWSVGNFKITEAIPYVIKVATTSDFFTIHSAIWAIGRCGTPAAIPFLQELIKKDELLIHSKQLAIDALLKLSEGKEKEDLWMNVKNGLPSPFQKAIETKDYQALEKQLREYLFELKTASNDYLINLYQWARYDSAWHERFISVVNDIPLSVNYFKHLRYIFKTAEMLEDFAVYGIIAKSIEKNSAGYNVSRWMDAQRKSKMAFSNRTKTYLTKRVVRLLNGYGKAETSLYTELATHLLLAFDDEKDMTEAFQSSKVDYKYDASTRQYNRNEKITYHDAYSRFSAFNFILLKNSTRYVESPQGWVRVAGFVTGAIVSREEAFPALWNNAPRQIIELLSKSKSERVHDFAQKVFKANPNFENQLETQELVYFLQARFAVTQKLGLELARKKYDRNAPDHSLLMALVSSALEEARSQGQQWIAEQRNLLTSDTEFVTRLILLDNSPTHTWLRGFLITIPLPREQSEIIITRVVAQLLSLPFSDSSSQYINLVSDTLAIIFSDTLRYVSLEVIRDMFRHPSTAIHSLAGKILMKHEVRPEHLPADFLTTLIQSDNAESRSLGISLLGKFPDELLLQKKDILVNFCLSPLADVRNSVKPIIFRLVNTYPDFGKELVDLFVPAFLIKESYEGVHDDLLSLLSNELAGSLHIIPKAKALLLLNSKFRSSQLMGEILLQKNIAPDQLTVPEVVKICSNPLQQVRSYGWNWMNTNPQRIKDDKEAALRLTDSYWTDTRLFAFDYFRNYYSAEEWTPDLLISLCDSTKEDVQDFGREMITKFFQQEGGLNYLLKLSQHPNTKIQLFTTSYLEQYAAGNLELIKSLQPYFITLLSQVNKGKVAKLRVMQFLRSESLKTEEAAHELAQVFARISVSVAIYERAGCIAALHEIKMKYPTVQSPILKKEYADYSPA
jgi:predicted DNA-binding WGR domain protein